MSELLKAANEVAKCLRQSAKDGMEDTDGYLKARRVLIDNVPESQLPEILHSCPTGEAVDDYLRSIASYKGSWTRRLNAASEQMRPLFKYLEFGQGSLNVIASPSDFADNGAPYAAATWEKITHRINDDPEGAVTLASKLLEDVCIAIIESSKNEPKGQNLKSLLKECFQLLGLRADDQEDRNVKALVGSIAQVAERIGSLRNSASDAHGARARSYRPQPRHAKLAVNAAGTTAVFLLETAKERGLITS